MTHAKENWSDAEIEFILENYPNYGQNWCAEKLGRSICSISRKAFRLGLNVSSEARSRNCSVASSRPRPELCGVDASTFINCTTKEVAYTLGLLWADGYLNNKSQKYKISLELTKIDFDNILPILQKCGEWTVAYRARVDRKPQGTAMTSNKALYEFLRKCNYETKSISSATKILSYVKPELHRYWWRGYFDGDGCWYVNIQKYLYQMSMAGSYEQDWSFVDDLACRCDFKYSVRQREGRNNKSSAIVITRKQDLIRFGEFIYSEYDGIGLARKYEKYVQIRQRVSGL
jgi:hypothetical protein